MYRDGGLYSKSLAELQKTWKGTSGSLIQLIEDKDDDEEEEG